MLRALRANLHWLIALVVAVAGLVVVSFLAGHGGGIEPVPLLLAVHPG
jgi:uncharacterized membrane protein YfcA